MGYGDEQEDNLAVVFFFFFFSSVSWLSVIQDYGRLIPISLRLTQSRQRQHPQPERREREVVLASTPKVPLPNHHQDPSGAVEGLARKSLRKVRMP